MILQYNLYKNKSVCLCVNQGGPNHNCYMYRLIILHSDPDTDTVGNSLLLLITSRHIPHTFPWTFLREKYPPRQKISFQLTYKPPSGHSRKSIPHGHFLCEKFSVPKFPPQNNHLSSYPDASRESLPMGSFLFYF